MFNGEAVISQQGQDISTSIRPVLFCAVQVVVGVKASHKQAHPVSLSTQQQVCSIQTLAGDVPSLKCHGATGPQHSL